LSAYLEYASKLSCNERQRYHQYAEADRYNIVNKADNDNNKKWSKNFDESGGIAGADFSRRA